MPRRRLLLRRRPLRPCRKLLSRILLLRQRRFPVLHPLPRRQLLPAPCNASTHTLPRRRLLPLHRPRSSLAVHARHVLRRHRPDCSDGQLRSRLLQQRRRCDVSVHEVPAGTVPGHSSASIVQGVPGRRILHRSVVRIRFCNRCTVVLELVVRACSNRRSGQLKQHPCRLLRTRVPSSLRLRESTRLERWHMRSTV